MLAVFANRYRLTATSTVVLVMLARLAIASDGADALERYDAEVKGAMVTDSCNPTFDWKTRPPLDTAKVGKNAYEKLLSDLELRAPGDARNAANAEFEFRLRLERVMREGRQSVAEKGCEDPEIQAQMRQFQRAHATGNDSGTSTSPLRPR
jgi:hypothetical protein